MESVHNHLLESNCVLQTSLNEINSHINIDKTTYQSKKDDLEKELDSVNIRLRKVRNKQFPK
jgi:hypothetical protein